MWDLVVNHEFPHDSEVIQRSIHCNRCSYSGSEVNNNRKDSKIMNAAFFCKSLLEIFMKELHFDLLDKLYNPLRQLNTARHVKPNPANRNIPKKDNWELQKFLLSSLRSSVCPMLMSKFQDVIKTWGHQRFHQRVCWGLSRLMNYQPWNLLNIRISGQV